MYKKMNVREIYIDVCTVQYSAPNKYVYFLPHTFKDSNTHKRTTSIRTEVPSPRTTRSFLHLNYILGFYYIYMTRERTNKQIFTRMGLVLFDFVCLCMFVHSGCGVSFFFFLTHTHAIIYSCRQEMQYMYLFLCVWKRIQYREINR